MSKKLTIIDYYNLLERVVDVQKTQQILYQQYQQYFRYIGEQYIIHSKRKVYGGIPKQFREGWKYTKELHHVDKNERKVSRERVNKHAKESSQIAINTFIRKNVTKVRPILENRSDLLQIKSDLDISGSYIKGFFKFIFMNKDEFTVRNQIVYVIIYGVARPTQYVRYPTTFHDVKIKSNFYKKVSQKFMIENFKK